MRAVDGDRGFGRHPGMADAVRAFHMRKVEPLGDPVRAAHLLIDLHAGSGAHHLHRLSSAAIASRAAASNVGRNGENGMGGVRLYRNGSADRGFDLLGERGEIRLGAAPRRVSFTCSGSPEP